MRKSLFTLILISALNSVFGVDSFTSTDKSEKWWGVSSQLGRVQPFENASEWDFRTHNGNQAAPILISSNGNVVWSEKPFVFKAKDGIVYAKNGKGMVVSSMGKNLKEAYLASSKKYFPPTGTLPDELFFSMPQYNTWIELMYNQNQADIVKYADDVIKNGFPIGVFMVDDNWQKYYGNFDFKPEKFPNPKEMTDYLHSKGFKIMLWICPFVSPDSPEFRSWRDNGYLVKDKSNQPLVVKWWNGYSAMIDLTNPKAFEFFKNLLEDTMKKYGIDGYKFDAGDTNYGVNAIFFDKNADAAEYSRKWVELGTHFKFNEYRASWKMAGQPVVQRLCDKNYSWKELQWLIPDMLAAGITGHAYSCPDMIGGGEFRSFLDIDQSKLDQKLIVRSAQVHALMPMMQFSVAPWRVLDKKHMQICANAAHLHAKFGNYILELARQASKTGDPIVRHMEYEFPHQGFAECKDQFMLGDKYLVAPIVTPEDARQVILPNGKWKDDQGKIWDGGQTIKIEVPIERLPYFERLK